MIVITLALLGPRATLAEDPLADGDRLAAEGRLSEAIESYSRFIAQHPERADAHARLGGMYLLRQEYTQAVKSFRQSVSLNPGQARAFVGMGMAYLHLGDYSLARAAFDEAKRLEPELGADIEPVLTWLDGRSGDVDLTGH